MNNSVTVIVPVFNASKFLNDTMNSILEQSYPHIKILCIDDCSNDDSYAILNNYAKTYTNITVLRNGQNIGYLETTNKLLSLVNSDYVCFWDADDICNKYRIEKQVNFLSFNPEYHLVGSNCSIIDEKSRKICRVRYPKTLSTNDEIKICGSSILFKRSILDVIGSYNPLFNRIGSEDFEWVLRCLHKYKYYCIQEELYSYRRTPNSITLQLDDKSIIFSISHKLVKKMSGHIQPDCLNSYWTTDNYVESFNFHKSCLLEEQKKDPIDFTTRTIERYIYSGEITAAIKTILKYGCKHNAIKAFFLFFRSYLKYARLKLKTII